MEGNDQEFLCLVCLEYYDDKDRIPKNLSCQHNVCFRCALAMFLTFDRCITCPLCSSTCSSSTPEELPTDVELLNSVKVLQLFSHRDHFWCMKCVGPPNGSCFSSHQVLLPAFDQELQTLCNLSEHISQHSAKIQSTAVEFCIMEQEWNAVLFRLERVVKAWKDRIDQEKSRVSSLNATIHSLTFSNEEYFHVSNASSIRNIQLQEMTIQNNLGTDVLAQRALDVVRNAVSEAEDLIRVTDNEETDRF